MNKFTVNNVTYEFYPRKNTLKTKYWVMQLSRTETEWGIIWSAFGWTIPLPVQLELESIHNRLNHKEVL